MAFEPESFEYGLTYRCFGAGWLSSILTLIYIFLYLFFGVDVFEVGLFLALSAWMFLLIAICGMIMLSLSGNLFIDATESKMIRTGAILFGISFILLLGILWIDVGNLDSMYYGKDALYDDTIVKLESPLVLLQNGTWVGMPWLWLSDDEYVYLSDRSRARILREENITRYSEMVDRYGSAGCMCVLKASARKNSKNSPNWWEFWDSGQKNVVGDFNVYVVD